jgi:hypothetical protein
MGMGRVSVEGNLTATRQAGQPGVGGLAGLVSDGADAQELRR